MSSTPTESRPASPTEDPTTPIAAFQNYRFNYGKGPESVSGTTDAAYVTAGNNPPLNLHLNFSASTANLTGVTPQEWSSSRDGFNAISTVLNNPHKRQAPPKAHSSLPAVPPADLPRVKRKDFDGYLRAIASEHSKFESSHTAEAPAEGGQPASSSLPPLDTIPDIFFSPSFNLADPTTFNQVSESADPTSLSHSLPLQEKLSHYLDTLEIHLSHEITLRSSSFFTALSNLQTLHSESTTCLSQITRLRGMLAEVDDRIARKGLEVVRVEQKMRNVAKVEEGVKGLEQVVKITGEAREAVSMHKWDQALGVLGTLDGMWEEKAAVSSSSSLLEPMLEEPEETATTAKRPLDVPLSAFTAFSALPTHLRTLTLEIAARLSEELVGILKEDFTRFVETKAKRDSETFKEALNTKISALIRTNGLKEATLSWREVVLGDLGKWVVQRHFEAKGEGSENENPTPDPKPELKSRLLASYTDVLSAIEILQSQSEAIREVVESLNRLNRSSPSSTSVAELQEDLHTLLTQFTSTSHSALSSHLTTNSEYLTTLDLGDFVEVYKATYGFVVECEVRCKCMVVALRGGLGSVGKGWLNTFHQSRLNQQAKAVEDEVWNAAEVTEDVQRVVRVIVDAAVRDGELLDFSASSSTPTPTTPAPTTPMPTTPNPSNSGSKPPKANKHLLIDTHTYHLVPCTSHLLFLLVQYLRLPPSLSVSGLTTDVMSRTMEFLKTFNSRVCQVVLGAGAMRSAGLRNITARHLALASQSLSIMIALIPYVREMFRRHLSQKQAVMLVEFDKLKRDYQEHQNEIHAKLIAIMGDRLSAHIKSLQAVDWSLPGKTTSSGSIVVNDYMELLVKETVTLHKVLSRYLSSGVVEDVMSQVFAAINHRLSEEYSKIDLPSADAKMRLLSDAKYLHSRLSALKNVGVLSNMLEIVVQEKRLPGAKVPSSPSYLPPPRPHSPRQPSSSPLSNPNHNQHQQPPNQNQAQSQQKATTSQRLKGLLSRSTSGSWGANFPPAKEKETPNPNPNSANANGNGNAEASPRASSSSIRDGSELKRSASGSGFRHFEAPGSPLPPLPPTPSALAARGSSELLPPGGGATSPNPLSVTPSPSPSPAPPPPPPEKEKGKDEDEDGQGQVLEGQGEGEGETRLEASYGPENGGVESKEMDTDMDKNTQQTLTEEAVTVPSPPGEGREESQPIQS